MTLKINEISVNLESLSIQTKKNLVDDWYKKSKEYFKVLGFKICDEKYINKQTCKQYKAELGSSGEIYTWNFYLTGRITIFTKTFRKQFIEKRLPDFQKVFQTSFSFKDAKASSQTKFNELQNQYSSENNLSHASGTSDGNDLLEKIIQDNSLEIQHELDSTFDETSPINSPTQKIATENETNFKVISSDNQPKKKALIYKTPVTNNNQTIVVNEQSKPQKLFNNQIENEQVNIIDRINKVEQQLTNFDMANIIKTIKLEVKQEMDNDMKSLKNELNMIKNENIDLHQAINNLNASKQVPQGEVENFLIESLESNEMWRNEIISLKAEISEIDKKLATHKQQNEKFKSTLNDLENFCTAISESDVTWNVENKTKARFDKDKNQDFEFLILGDSITKFIDAGKIAKCDKSKTLNLSKSGARVFDIYEQYRSFKRDFPTSSVSKILIHVGTNHLPKCSANDTANKIGRLLLFLREEMVNTKIYYSSILPKKDTAFLNSIYQINCQLYSLCFKTHNLFFINHTLFYKDQELNPEMFRQDRLHPSGIGTRQLARDFIQYIRGYILF